MKILQMCACALSTIHEEPSKMCRTRLEIGVWKIDGCLLAKSKVGYWPIVFFRLTPSACGTIVIFLMR